MPKRLGRCLLLLCSFALLTVSLGANTEGCQLPKLPIKPPQFPLPEVDVVIGDPLIFTITLKDINIPAGGRFTFSDLPGLVIEVVPTTTDKPARIIVTVPLALFGSSEINALEPGTLPGGRPLPRVIEGQLPSLSITVPQWNNMVFYIGRALSAVFIPSDMKDPDFEVTVPIRDNNNKDLGYITRVPQDESKKNGGFFIAVLKP